MYVKIHNQVWMVNVNLTMDAEDPKLNNTPIFWTKRINNNKQFIQLFRIYFPLKILGLYSFKFCNRQVKDLIVLASLAVCIPMGVPLTSTQKVIPNILLTGISPLPSRSIPMPWLPPSFGFCPFKNRFLLFELGFQFNWAFWSSFWRL